MHIFLDLDGTLVDPKPGITGSVIHSLRTLGLIAPSADDLEWVIGPPLLDSFKRLGAADPHEALAIYRETYSAGAMFDVTIYPGIPETLALLGQHHNLHLATAKPHVFATQITAHVGLDRYLDQQYGPELDGTRDDKGALLAYACETLGIAPSKAVMVGDRLNDLNAAQANGMPFIGVSWGYGSPGELDGADDICKSPDGLTAAISDLTVPKS